MTQLLHRDAHQWTELGGIDTASEIAQQPAVWRALAASLQVELPRIANFLGDSLRNPAQQVVLTGAGSSAYAGEMIADTLNAAWPAQVRAVPTTSLLTHAELLLDSAAPTLVVSFARSGDSPESVAAVELVRTLVPAARFLHITCNADGALARQADGDASVCTLLMPAASCDRAFAMTSSLTCMVLAALCVLSPGAAQEQQDKLATLATLGEQALAAWAAPLAELGARPVERVIYLGAGPLEALAKEAALKVLELTAGQVQAMANTPLGFRHGPKAAVNAATVVVLFRSAKPLARRYDDDLLAELRRDGVADRCLTVGFDADIGLALPAAGSVMPGDAWLAPLWLLMAQQYALHQSARLALRPDNPFAGGIVNRVVQGVTIYPHTSA